MEALELFRFQYGNNGLYQSYVDTLGVDPNGVKALEQIPFLPISFFKTHTIKTTDFEAEKVFESSGTTQTINSRHHVKSLEIYLNSIMQGFEKFYGDVKDWCIIGLLPSYLERNNASLVFMVDELIKQSGHPRSGFYLNEYEKLQKVLQELEKKGQKTLLIGVSFALLDMAEQFPLSLKHTVVMETGGMKGRREEITRQELHGILKSKFNIDKIHSEYGMTELLSQAYSKGDGIFYTAPRMKILLRDEEDPFEVWSRESREGIFSGVINVIDLANIYSCAFIATDDAGRLHEDGGFEVLGRIDNSDLRGCSLMMV